MADTRDWNTQVIEQFRANGGKVGGQFEGAPLLLLNTTGAKSGKRRGEPDDVPGRGGPTVRLRLEGRGTDQPGLVPQSGRAP